MKKFYLFAICVMVVSFAGCEPNTPATSNKGFSVSDSKKVTFSKGNLQYTQSTNTWSFAENQIGRAHV